jgi:hypothetical protein
MTAEARPSLESLRPRLDQWLESALERQLPLTFRDVRKGVQALSSRYVERRGEKGAIAKALDGPARRAAFATYYAGLHLLQAFLAAQRLRGMEDVERIFDLGAGTGAVGFGVALTLPTPATVHAYDRSGWALAEARQAGRDVGVPVRTRKQDLAKGLPRIGSGDALVAGWFLNELEPTTRGQAVDQIAVAREAGARVLVLEPLAGVAAPWWPEVASRLGFRADDEVRERIALPQWLRDMDRAAGLDHSELRARAMGDLT